MVASDTAAAVAFLEDWEPGGPWVLTSIVPDGKTQTCTFDRSQLEELKSWIDDRQGRENVYFHVNPTIERMTRKAGKEHIARLAWLHVDIDPRAGEDLTSERERAFQRLSEFVPPPTVIIDSGGGYQGFWKLEPDDRLVINGDPEKAIELEAYNRQLENEFDADRCHNVDRIMRLPGTVNVPTKKKRKKGRKPTLAKLVAFHHDRTYEIDSFTPAVQLQAEVGPGGGLAGGRPKVQVSGNVERVDIDDLDQWDVPDYTKMLIVQGTDPEDPTKYPSRSEALFRVSCDLVRLGVPDEVVYSILTDPDFGIAESVLEKGSRSEKYALRQIEQAHEHVINPALRELNNKFAVIGNLGGKCRVVEEVYDPALGRSRLSTITFEDLRNRYMHRKVEIGQDKEGNPILKPMGQWWLQNENRRQYDRLIFAPGREVHDSYNLWQGFVCDALPGEKHESFLEHVRTNICGSDDHVYAYLLDWLARMVQFPATPGEVAIVLRGRQGTGKSFFAKKVGQLFGRHFLQVSDPKHLVGSFNAHLRDAVFLFGDEAFYAGDKKHESVLKTMITEETLIVEGKGVDAELVSNCLHVILASNSQWVIPAGAEERRFLVLDVGEEQIQNTAYFRKINDDLENGGFENLLHFLKTRDITEFEVRTVPKTVALQDQKVLSMSPEQQWWHEKLIEGRLIDRHHKWEQRVLKDLLYEDYIETMKSLGLFRRSSSVVFGKFLAQALPPGWPKSKQEVCEVEVPTEVGPQIERRRKYILYLPNLEAARAYWSERYSGFNWEPVEEIPEESTTKEIPF